jgi:DNA-binding MarR family transcriptional regulator
LTLEGRLGEDDHGFDLAEHRVLLERVIEELPEREQTIIRLRFFDEMTQTEIAQAVGLDKTTMVVTVDELEKAGLAERIPSETDRRARLIRVTPAGVEKAAEAEKIVAELQDEILATLPAAEREALMRGLNRLVDDRLSTPSECGRAVRRRD